MVIFDRMYKHGYKWILVAALILAAWFGYSNGAYAVTYDELNAQKGQAGLPFLTGDDQIDFQMLASECNGGIKYSCALAEQLQQQREPVYTQPESQIEPLPLLGEPDQIESSPPLNRVPILKNTSATNAKEIARNVRII